MKARPMIFGSPMVRAILANQKTLTRRVVKLQPHGAGSWVLNGLSWVFPNVCPHTVLKCPYGVIGDRIWVRESYSIRMTAEQSPEGRMVAWYKATSEWADEIKWKTPLFMPRAASRIELEITDIRIERLRSISRGDCMAEGCPFPNMQTNDPIGWYADLWESINGQKHPWSDNPWVWVIQFERVEVAA